MSAWRQVCELADLQLDTGTCVLVDDQQIAIFYVTDPTDGESQIHLFFAISNYDPFGCANVLSRGICGDINGQHVVASPLYKHHFDLQTGVCLEDETVTIPVYPIRVNNEKVEILLETQSIESE